MGEELVWCGSMICLSLANDDVILMQRRIRQMHFFKTFQREAGKVAVCVEYIYIYCILENHFRRRLLMLYFLCTQTIWKEG